MITDLRTPPRASTKAHAIALDDQQIELEASAWPMVTFIGAVMLSLALLALVAG